MKKKNFFDFFALPTQFDIDLNELEKKYLQFQKQFHPDKSNSSDIEQAIIINQAYKTLCDDFFRACYLLELKNVDISSDKNNVKPDIATLAAILELQEKIFVITDKNELENLQKEINQEFKSLIINAIYQLESLQIEASAQLLIKAKYLKKSLQDIKNQKNKLD
jgi:molecular chaperone HscB